jgi:integrating conjugative element protein (TIGR03765 family)
MTGALLFFMALVMTLASQLAEAKLVVIADQPPTVSAAPYLAHLAWPSEKAIDARVLAQVQSLVAHPILEPHLLYPNHSDFTPGVVDRHHLNVPHGFSMPMFLIGTDARSVHWATVNAAYLKAHHVMGMITNVQTPAQTQRIEHLTGLTLIPTSVAGLSTLLGTDHLPVFINQHEVMQ